MSDLFIVIAKAGLIGSDVISVCTQNGYKSDYRQTDLIYKFFLIKKFKILYVFSIWLVCAFCTFPSHDVLFHHDKGVY